MFAGDVKCTYVVHPGCYNRQYVQRVQEIGGEGAMTIKIVQNIVTVGPVYSINWEYGRNREWDRIAEVVAIII